MPIQTVFLHALSHHGVAAPAAELHVYHQTHNLRETIPDEVM